MHFHSRRVLGPPLIALLSFILPAPLSHAADHFLAIGGGDSPSNNQISLEKNVLFFQRLLSDAGENRLPDVLFSDGSAGSRDIQFVPDEDPPRLNLLMSRLFNQEHGVNFRYRAHKLSGLRGTSTRRGLEEWFNNTGKNLKNDDRLFIYFTGHGGTGMPTPQNTTISMWCERPMPVSEFVHLLDLVPPKVQVVLIMVQCHSGGFANVLFNDAKPGGELSPARRCGFFATTSDRKAAGCTPDTVEDDYRDYSTYFFAALDGKTRDGKALKGCDLDGDGHVSFAEAHAYVMIHSDTIDIPVTTSDAFLRVFSKSSGGGLTRPQSTYQDLLDLATVPQKTVLEELSEQLKLTTDDRYDETKRLADLIEAERKTLERDRAQKTQEATKLADRIRRKLVQHWPELSNPWHPRVPELTSQEGPQIQLAIEKDSNNPRWQILRRDCDNLEGRALDLERKWVKCQRMIRTLETVALAVNLERVAAPGIVERYKQLVADEGGVLPQKITTAR